VISVDTFSICQLTLTLLEFVLPLSPESALVYNPQMHLCLANSKLFIRASHPFRITALNLFEYWCIQTTQDYTSGHQMTPFPRIPSSATVAVQMRDVYDKDSLGYAFERSILV